MKTTIKIILFLSFILSVTEFGSEGKTPREPGNQIPEVAQVMCNMDSLLAVGTRLVMNQKDTSLIFGITNCISSTPKTPSEEVMVEIGMRHYDRAEESLVGFLKKSDISPTEKARLFFFKGIASYLKADTVGALKAFDSSLKYNPAAPEVLTSRGIVQFDLAMYYDAIDNYDSAIALRHDYSEAWYQRGNTYFMMGQNKKSLEDYDTVLALRPKMNKARYNKAAMLHRLGRLDDAMASFDTILTIEHDDYLAWNGKGLIYNRWEDNEKALACFDSSLAYNRDNVEAWNNKAATLGAMKKYKEAFKCIDSSLYYKPDNLRTIQLRDLIKQEQKAATDK
jgi:tetratricopeptide (TPR) repeat protein